MWFHQVGGIQAFIVLHRLEVGYSGVLHCFHSFTPGFIVFNVLDSSQTAHRYLGDHLEDLFHVPWLFMAMPLGVLSLLFTVISIRKREPKRRSLRNVGLALFAALFYPAAWVFLMGWAGGA